MGVLNVTPDSFSDGGAHADRRAAFDHGYAMHEAGVDIVDVGGESTRPGADAVPADEELRRVVPAIGWLAAAGVVVSVDTSKPSVARAAVAAGAAIVNDVTGLRDPEMIEVLTSCDAGVVVMHMLGTPRTMQADPTYADVVTEVRDHLVERATAAESAGISRDRIVIDPGIGFGKTLGHNLELLAGLDELVRTGYPVLVGASRKSFMAKLIGEVPPGERDAPTHAVHALAIAHGAAVIRVHDAVGGVFGARSADAIVRLNRGGGT
ncbi:MAG TPA: dihydropteroate synthase [Acidimicrobiia bacterium]|nr:dihydropteroate synthase [Acidimicrobiia bacterium]